MTLSPFAAGIATSIFIISTFTTSIAQDFAPSISMSGGLYPKRDLTDTIGSYSHQRATIGFSVPLFKKVKLTDEGLRFGLLSFMANSTIDNTNISFLTENRLLIATNASLNGIYKSGKKSMWIGRLSASAFEDETTIKHPSLRWSGFALYRRSPSESFFYLLGGAYTFSFGRGLALPVLGAGWKFTNRSSFTVILPLNMNYRFGKPGRQYSIFLRPNGGLSNFANNNLYASAPDQMIFRRREINLGIHKKFRLSSQCSLFIESGIMGGRKISFNEDLSRDDSKVIFESKVKASGYLSAGLRFKLSKKELPDVDVNDYDLGL